jgi:hypothetical protein
MIRLNEVIWEITDRCTNNCDYCGSKEHGIRVSRDPEKYAEIAQAIAKYPPKEVNISGGDPMLVPWKAHYEITDIFKCKGIKSKILVNPQSLPKTDGSMPYGESEWGAILDLYDGIGVSINTERECELYTKYFKDTKYRPTIITNFNKTNLWMFETIFDVVQQRGLLWQIQLTMYKDKNSNAIYESEYATKTLCDKINSAMKGYKDVIVADNFNGGACGAGMSSLGVLCNGDVIPCLSMVSWTDAPVQGNLLKESMGQIWETGFRDWRFGTPKCCKDHCNRVCFEQSPSLVQKIMRLQPIETPFPKQSDNIRPPWMDNQVMMYAVQTYPPGFRDSHITTTSSAELKWIKTDEEK